MTSQKKMMLKKHAINRKVQNNLDMCREAKIYGIAL